MPGVLEFGTVMVTHDGRALTALRPVPTGGVATGRGEEALRVPSSSSFHKLLRDALKKAVKVEWP